MSPSIDGTQTAMPGKPSSATSMFDPRPTTSTGRPEASRLGDENQVGNRARLHEQRCPTADLVRSERAEWRVGNGELAEDLGRDRQR